jgi:hypothetical protein
VEEVDGQHRRGLHVQESGNVEIRMTRIGLNNSMYRADDEVLIRQYAYGIPPGQAPVLHLRQVGDGEVATAYLESVEQAWAGARPLE